MLKSLFILFLFSSSLHPETTVGNGGNVVVCRNPDKTIKSVELLDFYEAKIQWEITPNLGNLQSTIEEKIQALKQKKQQLFDALVGESADLFKKLTWDDVRELFSE